MAGDFTVSVKLTDSETGKEVKNIKEYFSKLYLAKNGKALGEIKNGTETSVTLNTNVKVTTDPAISKLNKTIQMQISNASGDIFEYLLGVYLMRNQKIKAPESEEGSTKPDISNEAVRKKVSDYQNIELSTSYKDGDRIVPVTLNIFISDAVVAVIEQSAKTAAEKYAEAHPYSVFSPSGAGGNPLGDVEVTTFKNGEKITSYVEAKWSKSPQSAGAGIHWWRPSIYNFTKSNNDEDTIIDFLKKHGLWNINGRKKISEEVWIISVQQALVNLINSGKNPSFLSTRIRLDKRDPKSWIRYFISKGLRGSVKGRKEQSQKVELGKDIIIGIPPVYVSDGKVRCEINFSSKDLDDKINNSHNVSMKVMGTKSPYTAFYADVNGRNTQIAQLKIEKHNLRALALYGASQGENQGEREKMSVTYDFYILNKFLNKL